MNILTLLDNQDIRFDNHTRTKETSKKGLHFHKTMKDNAKKPIAKAEILIYLDGTNKWETRGKNHSRLEQELREIFSKQNEKQTNDFVLKIYERIVDYGERPTNDDEKSELRDTIIRAFYGDEKLEIQSTQMDESFKSKISMSYVPKDKRFIQTKFNESNKTIILKDKTKTIK